ncbi:MAG: M42 family peptidase, partial [Firmicutes bacterium]|nr:M42 family peptidase [Bacillota bacterium]
MLLKKLSEAAGVSGNEAEVRRIIVEEVKRLGLEPIVDVLGNVIAPTHPGGAGGDGGSRPRVMLAAHMDEAGLIVTYVEKEGFLRFRKVGGIDDRVLPSK